VIIVAIVSLFGLCAVHGWRTHGTSRRIAAQAHMLEQCRAFRATPGNEDAEICREPDPFAPSPLDALSAGRDGLDVVSADLDRGDQVAARDAMAPVIARMHEVQRRAPTLGTMIAASITRRALEVIDAHRDRLDAGARRALLAGLAIDDPARAVEADHVHLLWTLARQDGGAALVAAVADDEAPFATMARAISAGDVATCRGAANELEPVAQRSSYARLCEALGQVAPTRARLDAARLDAAR
jgi:hypothetical protein